jgi:hypothetical protein
VVQALIDDLIERGLDPAVPRLFIIRRRSPRRSGAASGATRRSSAAVWAMDITYMGISGSHALAAVAFGVGRRRSGSMGINHSVQPFHLDDRGAVIASGPESGRSRRAVDIHAADIGRAWQQIFGDLARLRIEPRHPVSEHPAGPDLAVIVRHDVVGSAPRRRDLPFRDLLGLGIEQADGAAAIFGKPQPVLGVNPAAPRP